MQALNLRDLFDSTCKRLGGSPPERVKAVKGLTNETKTPEILEKGILRAKHDLLVFKDGTIRFDAINAPLTHFKPSEVGVSVEKLRQIGYATDCTSKPLADPEQICELKMQDVVIPRKCGEYFVQVAHFLDELLERVYDAPQYYHIKQLEDLVGSSYHWLGAAYVGWHPWQNCGLYTAQRVLCASGLAFSQTARL